MERPPITTGQTFAVLAQVSGLGLLLFAYFDGDATAAVMGTIFLLYAVYETITNRFV